MATLSNVTSLTRKLLKWLGLGIAALLVLMLVFKIIDFVKQQITPPPPPTVSFGKLPAIEFPPSQTGKTLSYSIDTITGALPVFSDRAAVYKTIPSMPELLALNKATSKVQSAGFNSSGTQLSEGVYQWTQNPQGLELQKKMVLNIFSGDFNLSSNFLEDSQVLAGNNLPNETAAINSAENLLSNMSSMPDDIIIDKTLTGLFSIKNGKVVSSTSLSTAQIVQVSFFQRDLGGFPIVYPNSNASTINVFVGGGPNSPQIVQADFFHQNISSENATYPILSTSQALDKLKDGEGYIASYDGDGSEISVNKVFLAYYLSNTPQEYVLPVVVFKGNKGFTAYVSAVRDDWIQK